MKPTVSVIIPTYNRAHVLERAIESVFSQTYQNLELIVVDDGSIDDTPALLDRFTGKIKMIRQENRGVSAARNRGIQESSGTYLAFLDSDDWWINEKLAAQIHSLEESGNQVVHTEEIWIRNGKRVNQCKHHKKSGGWIYEQMLPLCAISPSSILLNRSVLDQSGLFDESFPVCEDYDLWLRITSRFAVDFLETPLIYKTGGHEDQLSRSMPGMDWYRVQALGKALKHCPLNEVYRKKTMEMMLKKASIFAAGCRKRGKDLEAEELMKYVQELVPGTQSTERI